MRLLAFFMIIANFFILLPLFLPTLPSLAQHDDDRNRLAEGYSNDLGKEEVIRASREQPRPLLLQQQQSSDSESSIRNGQDDYHHRGSANKHRRLHRLHHRSHYDDQTRPIASHRRHHHSSKLRDDEVVSKDRDSSSAKTNPLIEWPLLDAANRYASFEQDKLGHRRRYSNHRGSHLEDGSRARRAPKENPWCHRACSGGREGSMICASDGHLYGSYCELRREACRRNVHLLRRPMDSCQSPSSSTVMNGSRTDSLRPRVIELKRSCTRLELEQMKQLLLRQFNDNIGALFSYLDNNADGFVEAHELWPKRGQGDANKLMYAQVWDKHLDGCGSGGFNPEERRVHSGEKSSKCWYLLDFVFEPIFDSNPCSLSHLLLLEFSHPNNKFTLDSFERVFKDAKVRIYNNNSGSRNNGENNNNNNGNNNKPSDLQPVKRFTPLNIELGGSASLRCLEEPLKDNDPEVVKPDREGAIFNNIKSADGVKCLWTRQNVDLADLQDPHISIEEERIAARAATPNSAANPYSRDSLELTLQLKDAQLYLSGQFKCSCQIAGGAQYFEHIYQVQVLAKPRVNVRPKSQWSLPNSRITFECHYDYIDTSLTAPEHVSCTNDSTRDSAERDCRFGLQVEWLKDNREPIVDSKRLDELMFAKEPDNRAAVQAKTATLTTETSIQADDSSFYSPIDNNNNDELDTSPSFSSLRFSHCSSRASITMASSRLTLESLQLNDTGSHSCRVKPPYSLPNGAELSNQAQGNLLVQEQPPVVGQPDEINTAARTYLWMFHDNGISIYKLQNDDGQEMELEREINGHSLVSAEVDGNWNQLTLCGGLNPEQVVICEWSDNALSIDVNFDGEAGDASSRKYIYVGQPNLNRIIVMDGLMFEIVAIVNTEPQPRRLHLYKPSKIHLSKWVRHRLSPKTNARWLSAIGAHAHSLKSTPDARSYSSKPLSGEESSPSSRVRARRFSANQKPSPLIQHDIWLLCYGQPLVVDPSGDEHLEDSVASFEQQPSATFISKSASNDTHANPRKLYTAANTIQPFTPRLSPVSTLAWSLWLNKESRLRNRKSVHIIQSTFFPKLRPPSAHVHNLDEAAYNQAAEHETSPCRRGCNDSVVSEFKKSTVLTTHHVFAAMPRHKARRYLNRVQVDLIQDLHVPAKPYSLENDDRHNIHYSYVTHYDERRLFRISMDEYRYDQEIDLQNCDPINLMTTAQGLLIVQCRAPITHKLIGQVVLDQLTNAQIEFNANVQAQESYLTPDHRYLISILNNSTAHQVSTDHNRQTPLGDEQGKFEHSVIYVQMVSVSGLKLQYEIKTSLEISHCTFVWKDGYYAAIFISTNHREQQSEILNLRLADSRLELMARVPGLVSSTRHKNQLVVSQELKLAALSTNQGTYVVDLEDNRVSQSLRHHQSPPTLLWV